MNNFRIIPLCVPLVLSISILLVPLASNAQQQFGTNNASNTTPLASNAQQQFGLGNASNTTSASGNSLVSISASVSVPVTNESLRNKDTMLRSAVIGFLNSGANVLKIPDEVMANVKTKIANQVSNMTQNVEGSEATNAIIGVEITKALRSLISSKGTGIVTVDASSTCKAPTDNMISCDNTVNIK